MKGLYSKKAIYLTFAFTFMACLPSQEDLTQSSDGSPEAGESITLENIKVPKGFRWETTQPVTINVTVNESRRENLQALSLEVRKANGDTIYRGFVGDLTEWKRIIRTALPTAETELQVTVSSSTWTLEETISVGNDGTANLLLDQFITSSKIDYNQPTVDQNKLTTTEVLPVPYS